MNEIKMENTENKQVTEFQCSINDADHWHKIAVFYPWGEHDLTEKYCVVIYVPEDKFYQSREENEANV